MNKTTAILLSAFLALPIAAQSARRRPSRTPLVGPQCTVVTGTPAVTFSRDGGATTALLAEPLTGVRYTYGVAALTQQNLVAFQNGDLLQSTDGGCRWRLVMTVEGPDLFPPTLVRASATRAYAYSDNRRFFFRFDERGGVTLKSPGEIIGLGVDAANANHVRAGLSDGTVWDSADAGESWSFLGQVVTRAIGYYRFAFDPANLDHIVAGTIIEGAFVSRDGARTWGQSSGFGSNRTNVFQVVISPADPNYVWAMGLDLARTDVGPDFGRHIYLSTDGGLTFAPVVDAGPTVQLINQPVMAAHPTDRNVVYFVFGTFFQNYGTDLFRYDHATKSLTTFHYAYDDIDAIAFAPGNPSLMYFGLESVRGVN